MKELILVIFIAVATIWIIIIYVKAHYINRISEARIKHESEMWEYHKELTECKMTAIENTASRIKSQKYCEVYNSTLVITEDNRLGIVRDESDDLVALKTTGIINTIALRTMAFNKLYNPESNE